MFRSIAFHGKLISNPRKSVHDLSYGTTHDTGERAPL